MGVRMRIYMRMYWTSSDWMSIPDPHAHAITSIRCASMFIGWGCPAQPFSPAENGDHYDI